MHGEQPLPRAPAPSSALRRATSGSGRSGLYGEVVTLPEYRLTRAAEGKTPV